MINYSQFNQLIRDIQFSIDGLLIRMESIEKKVNQLSENIIDDLHFQKYLVRENKQPKKQQLRNVSKNHFIDSQLILSPQTKHKSIHLIEQTQQNIKQNILDMKSFRLIKHSILLNTNHIEKIDEAIRQIQRQHMKKIVSLEEGIKILTSLWTHLQKQLSNLNMASDEVKRHQYQTNEIIKYESVRQTNYKQKSKKRIIQSNRQLVQNKIKSQSTIDKYL